MCSVRDSFIMLCTTLNDTPFWHIQGEDTGQWCLRIKGYAFPQTGKTTCLTTIIREHRKWSCAISSAALTC